MNDPVTTAPTISQTLGAYAAGTPASAIAAPVREAAKLLLLDTLAVAWAGSDAPGCSEVHELLKAEGGRGDSTAWAYGGRLPATAAAFVNSMCASALDYDSIGLGVAVHGYIAAVPGALALAERQKISGEDFLAALVLGADVAYRVAAAAAYPNRGFHYTGALGVFAAATACARVLRLAPEQAAHALGIAFGQAAGTQQMNIEPSLSKRTLSAFAARAGVFAAELAQRGITAPAQVFEGQFGLYALYQPGDPAQLTAGLGEVFHADQFSIKLYPSCGCNHTTIDAVMELVEKHELAPDDVLSVEVTVTPYINRLVGGHYDPSGDAQVAAQFNLAYSVACVLVRRRLGLAEIQTDVARDPEIARHIPKVSIRVDESQSGVRGPVTVRMRTRQHGELVKRAEDVRGSPGLPITPAQADAKFRECFTRGARPLAAQTAERLMARVRELEAVTDMSRLFDGIV